MICWIVAHPQVWMSVHHYIPFSFSSSTCRLPASTVFRESIPSPTPPCRRLLTRPHTRAWPLRRAILTNNPLPSFSPLFYFHSVPSAHLIRPFLRNYIDTSLYRLSKISATERIYTYLTRYSQSSPASHNMKRHADQLHAAQAAAAPKRHRSTRSGHSTDTSDPTLTADTLPEPERGLNTTPVDREQQISELVTSSKSKAPPAPFTEVDSIRMQAEPFRLATAELPIDLVSCSWSHGTNRELDHNHVNNLYRAFRQGKLERRSPEHYIQVSCSAAAVQKMLSTMPNADSVTNRDRVLSFKNWAEVNDERPEVMAGQHRIEALKEYAKHTKADPEKQTWVCEIYDKGTYHAPCCVGSP